MDMAYFRTDDFAYSSVDRNHGIETTVRSNTLAVAPSNPDIIYAESDYPRPALFRTLDGGRTWSSPLLDDLFLNHSPNPANKVFALMKLRLILLTQLWSGLAAEGLYELKADLWGKVTQTGEITDLKVCFCFSRPYLCATYIIDSLGFAPSWKEVLAYLGILSGIVIH